MMTLLVTLSAFIGQTLTAQTASTSTEGPRQWISDYAQARHEAERLGLPLVIHFGATWCGPCQQMERETLNTPEVMKQLGVKFIGVKIDNDEQYELVKAFGVESLPTDMIVSPDGRIVAKTSAYRSSADYLASMKQWSGAFQKERQTAIAKLQPPVVKPDPQSSPMPSVNPMNDSAFIAKTTRPTTPPPPTESETNATKVAQGENLLVGLDGYSPVAVKQTKQWIKGQSNLTVTYQGVVYYMASNEEVRLFKANPERYSPRLLGCDPVELYRSSRAVQGSVEYGAFFDGELYLFGSLESRNQFKFAPQRYTNVQTAVRSDDIVGTRLR